MKIIYNFATLLSLLMMISLGNFEKANASEIIITKTSYVVKRKVSIMIFDKGNYSLEVINPDNIVEKSSGILNEVNLASLNKLIRNYKPISLKNEYNFYKLAFT